MTMTVDGLTEAAQQLGLKDRVSLAARFLTTSCRRSGQTSFLILPVPHCRRRPRDWVDRE